MIKQKQLQVHISLEKKKAGCIIPTMKCSPRNGELRDLDFTRPKLYHPYQYVQSITNMCVCVTTSQKKKEAYLTLQL